MAIADGEGLAALSMRRVAEAVGVSAMSLYTYVPSKAELVDLMFDRALGEAEDPGESVAGWRAKLAFVARQRWALVERHPWFLDVAMHRPPLGPNFLRKAEVVMKAFDGMGLDLEDMQLAAETLQNYMVGAMQAARAAREVEAQSGLTDEQWLSLIEPLLQEHFDPESYPVLARLSEARRPKSRTAAQRTAAFEFGLERMLDGLDAFIRARKLGEAAG
jgi:AcrR family transcriptional regulator